MHIDNLGFVITLIHEMIHLKLIMKYQILYLLRQLFLYDIRLFAIILRLIF